MADFELISFATGDELARAAATAWLKEVKAANRSSVAYCVALSGGRIARKFFAAVAGQAKADGISFGSVHFFWADERCVPPNDPESNFRLARETLFASHSGRSQGNEAQISSENNICSEPPHVGSYFFNGLPGISEGQIHRIRGEDSPETAAQNAGRESCRVVPANENGQPVLDLVFLGMGEDGHVASLFPGEPEAVVSSKSVYRAVVAAKPPARRITLGYDAIAAAWQVWVLVSGAGKEAALHESLRPGGQTPMARVLRLRDHTRIFSDI
jgi:6-phosphogluconolactonase